MRGTTLSLVIAGIALTSAGARADDVAEGPRDEVLFPAGDRLHGYLRGGETHVLQVHLAKGDVYSFHVAAKDRKQSLLLHLTVHDPAGREVNAEARVKHQARGKRVVLGPFRAAATGTYSLLLWGDGSYLNRGDFQAKSTVRSVKASYALPEDGSAVTVPVSAGATMRVRARKGLSSLGMAAPGQLANSFNAADPLVVSLRANGLASSTTGVYSFSAGGAAGAAVEITRPRWRTRDLTAPTFDELAADKIPAAFAPPAPPVAVQEPAPIAVPAPVRVDVPGKGTAGYSTLFFGGNINLAGSLSDAFHGATTDATPVPPSPTPIPDEIEPSPPIVTPPYEPPPPGGVPAHTGLGVPTKMRFAMGALPSTCVDLIGRSGLVSTNGYSRWRVSPWQQLSAFANSYPEEVRLHALPFSTRIQGQGGERGPDADPFVVQTHEVHARVDNAESVIGTFQTTTRYFVDGRPVDSMLALDGHAVIEWSVEGAGTLRGEPWRLTGTWRVEMTPTDVRWATNTLPACAIDGKETFTCGRISESVEVTGFRLSPFSAPQMYDPSGSLRNVLTDTSSGLVQVYERTFLPVTEVFGWDRQIPVETRLITIDPTTPVEGWIDEYDYWLWLC